MNSLTFTLSDALPPAGVLAPCDAAAPVSRGVVSRARFDPSMPDGPATRAMAGAVRAGACDMGARDRCDWRALVSTAGALADSGTAGVPTLPADAADAVPSVAADAGAADRLPFAHAAATTTVIAQQTNLIVPPWEMTRVGQGAERALTHTSPSTCCSSGAPGAFGRWMSCAELHARLRRAGGYRAPDTEHQHHDPDDDAVPLAAGVVGEAVNPRREDEPDAEEGIDPAQPDGARRAEE